MIPTGILMHRANQKDSLEWNTYLQRMQDAARPEVTAFKAARNYQESGRVWHQPTYTNLQNEILRIQNEQSKLAATPPPPRRSPMPYLYVIALSGLPLVVF